MHSITVHTDGACRGNPGPAAIAYAIKGVKAEAIEYFAEIGHTTNNQAEYQAMLSAVERLEELVVSGTAIEIFSDSELMVKQLNGLYKVKDANIKPIWQEIQGTLSGLRARSNSITITAIRREFNKRADYLANCALDKTQP